MVSVTCSGDVFRSLSNCNPGGSMRTSEWIQAGFATIFALAAWIFPLSLRRRLNVTLLALFALAGVALARATQYFLAPAPSSIFRDWMPVVITLVPYWQTGQFFIRPNEKIQAWLVSSERRVFRVFSRTGWRIGRAAHLSLEWAY